MNEELIKTTTDTTNESSCEKVSVTLQLDVDVLNWFLNQGNEKKHINETLRTYVENKTKQQLRLTDLEEIRQLLTSGKFG
jgi:uncharacterized protein (DUF4415 family)